MKSNAEVINLEEVQTIDVIHELLDYKKAYDLLLLKLSAEDRLFIEKYRKNEFAPNELRAFLGFDKIK